MRNYEEEMKVKRELEVKKILEEDMKLMTEGIRNSIKDTYRKLDKNK